MPLGDSITHGVGFEQGGSYCTPLWGLFTNANYNVDFVGTL